MSLKTANQKIKEIRKNKGSYLNLRGLGLTEIPQDISDMTYLLHLDLSYNNLTNFPESICHLDNLRTLDLSYNNLIDFYLLPGKTYCLKEIDISNNNLNFVPQELLELDFNPIIRFENNFFTENLPPEIIFHEDLSYIAFYLESLEKKLITPRLFETKIIIVGKGEVGKTTLLKTLNDEKFKFKLGKENSTHGIDIQSSGFQVIFPAKKPYYNRFEDFENLLLYDNDYDQDENYSQVIDQYDPLSELNFDEELQLDLRVQDQPFNFFYHNLFFQKEVKLNFWDFGGQEILYSTHQFFLTQRSVYLFVWEPRSDTESENFDYWLNTIEKLGENSPIIVVMNKADIRLKQIDEKAYSNKFKNIVSFHQVSCLTRKGIDHLKEKIAEEVRRLPHIGDLLPGTWNKTRRKLKKLDSNYITYSDFKSICNYKENKEVNFISSYLNDLGDIIHFPLDIRLRDIVIINPEWLTQAIYELIHSLDIQRNFGRFKMEKLEELLDENIYPRDKHLDIIAFMEKFEICFKIIGSANEFIIPALLPAQPNTKGFEDDCSIKEASKIEIRYSFLPSGIIERLICRMNSYIDKDNFWKFGVVFKHQDAYAIVQLQSLDKKLTFNVTGNLGMELFHIIQHNLDEIHNSLNLNDSDFQKYFGCNCTECSTSENPYMFEKETLKRFLLKRKNSIDCQKSTESINIKSILSGFKIKPTSFSLLRSFIDAASILQTRISTIQKADENQRNLYLLDLWRPSLMKYNYIPREQAQRGLSATGKNSGELDIVIEDDIGTTKTIFEGFNLPSINRAVIEAHINKLVDNYDRNGLKEKFIGIYSESKDFKSLSQKYFKQLENSEKLKQIEDISENYGIGEELKIFKSELVKYVNPTFLYHVLINLKN